MLTRRRFLTASAASLTLSAVSGVVARAPAQAIGKPARIVVGFPLPQPFFAKETEHA